LYYSAKIDTLFGVYEDQADGTTQTMGSALRSCAAVADKAVGDGEERWGPQPDEDAETFGVRVVITLLGIPDGDAGTDGGESEYVHEILGDADFLEELNHLQELSRFSDSPSVQPRVDRAHQGDVRHAMRVESSSAGRAEASFGECWPWDEAKPGHTLLMHDIETRVVSSPLSRRGVSADAIAKQSCCSSFVHVAPVHQWAKRQQQNFGTSEGEAGSLLSTPTGVTGDPTPAARMTRELNDVRRVDPAPAARRHRGMM